MTATPIQVGSYQLGRRIGEGGSAEVFAAASGGGGREVAVKLLGPHAELDDERARARFEREIELLAEIHHPNLVRLLDSGVDDELGPFLVTELLAGTSLRREVGLGPDVAALMVAPLVGAIGALHAAGLVHRDLKPENVLLTAEGRIVLIDLGLALRPGQTRFTDEGEVTGSLPYMAPEQIEGASVDSSADMWALGVLLYELACGRRPFVRERAAEEAAAILVGRYEPLATVDERTAPPISQLIDACLSRDPRGRPDAKHVAATLAEVVNWCSPEQQRGERRHHLEAGEELADRIVRHRIIELRTAARRAAEERPFESIRHLSRALAYAPEDPELVGELRAIETASHEVSPQSPAPRRHGLLAAIAVAAIGLAAVAVALLPDDRDGALLDGVSIASPPAEATVLDHITDAIVGDKPPGSRSDVAAKRLTGGMIQLLGRSLAGEENAEGTVVARQARPGERSNEELTLDVFGGMMDLLEEGVEAKRNVGGDGDRVTLTAPPDLVDDDPPRSLAIARAPAGEPLLAFPGRSHGQLTAALAEVRRQRTEHADNDELALAAATYELALGQNERGLRSLATLRAMKPTLALAHRIAAKVELRRGDLAAAQLAIDQALELDAKDPDALHLRGRVRFLRGQTRSAFVDLRAAVLANDRSPVALGYLAELYAATVGPDAARPLVRQLQTLTLDDKVGAASAHVLAEICRNGVAPACE